MAWVRMHPFITNWPGGGGPPVFEVNSDENGTAVVELAWDPQALLVPATYPDPLRYYATSTSFSATVPRASGGGSLSISLAAQPIAVTGTRAVFVIPQDLWAGYVEESLKTLNSPPNTTFSGNLYYRVRFTPTGSASSVMWPDDAILKGPDAKEAPHIGILRMSATVGSQVVPDDAAVNAMGGLPLLPDLWGKVLRGIWQSTPDSDPVKASLIAVFAHPIFRSGSVALRAEVLRLWLFAGKSRDKVPLLLSRQAVTGSGVVTPFIEKTALRGGKKLVSQLLALMTIAPHPDLSPITGEQIVDDVMIEILDPNGQVNQGGAGLCVPTSIQAFLIHINPAEYVRLVSGWLSKTGTAELASGASVTVPPAIYQIHRYVDKHGPTNVGFRYRTFSEMAFQGAALRFAKTGFPADAGTEASRQAIFSFVYEGGLNHNETKKLLDALFGVNFTLSQAALPAGPNTTLTGIQNAILPTFLTGLNTRQQQVLLAMYWGYPPWQALPAPSASWPKPGYGAHAVLALRNSGGRVFYKNPQYAGSQPPAGHAAGGNGTNPPQRLDDPAGSLESMTESDLRQWIYWYLIPDTALI